jgi:glycosyltransferase involved in cell wall biosynthesis
MSNSPGNRTPNALVSIVIPYFNESDDLKNLFEELVRDLPASCEAIFVDSSSTDNSSDLIDAWIAVGQHSRIRNLRTTSKSPGSARNIGIKSAHGELIGFMDCGLTVSVNWISEQLVALRSLPSNSWISGTIEGSACGILNESVIAITYGLGRVRAALPTSLVPRRAFDDVGLFLSIRAGEDREWSRRAADKGWFRAINKNVVVKYRAGGYTRSLGHLFRKAVSYARPAVYTHQRNIHLVAFAVFSGVTLAIVREPQLTFVFGVLYFVLRAATGFMKSRRSFLRFLWPHRMAALICTALILDVGRLIGTAIGITDLFRNCLKGLRTSD